MSNISISGNTYFSRGKEQIILVLQIKNIDSFGDLGVTRVKAE
jgi:hypothetical protein